MSKSLLDTDVLSEIIKGKNTAILAKANLYLAEHGRLTTSSVSLTEIIYGFRRMGREDRLAQFESSLASVEVIAFDDAASRFAGRINADLERKGLVIGMPDVMIAAIALRHSLAIVTGNVAHFEYVRSVGYELVIDSWRESG